MPQPQPPGVTAPASPPAISWAWSGCCLRAKSCAPAHWPISAGTISGAKAPAPTCAAWCDAAYGVGGYFVGVPARLGAGGVTEVLEFDLAAEEREAFEASVEHVRGLVRKLEEMGY